MTTKKLSPVELVIKELGIRPLARKLNITPGAISKWRKGTKVPQEHHARIIDISNGAITPNDLIYGR